MCLLRIVTDVQVTVESTPNPTAGQMDLKYGDKLRLRKGKYVGPLPAKELYSLRPSCEEDNESSTEGM